MPKKLVECVPNFSEGRDPAVIGEIVAAIRSVPGVLLLDCESDADHNRSVVTFAGPREAVLEGALRGVGAAVRRIDLTRHSGVHPRIGAADVVPFVPIEGVTLEDCARLAERAGEEIWRRFGVPVYLYEAAARRPDRVRLENIRRGRFEGLREQVRSDPARRPDIGEARLHPTAGAAAVGARKFLIAYNVSLNTPDVEIARRIARAVRTSSGGLPCVKAMGVPLASRNQAQVTMNLTDFEQTPLHRVFEAVRAEADRHGVEIAGSEIVGLVPRKAVEMAAGFYLRCANLLPGAVLENRLAELSASGADEFLEALAAPAPVPAGGSASAVAGAMAASLGAMVAAIAKLGHDEFTGDRRFLAEAARRDADAYDGVIAAYRWPKAERDPVVEEALKQATLVPLEVAERAASVRRRLESLASQISARLASDVETGLLLAGASVGGALASVRANLARIKDGEFRRAVKERAAKLQSR